MKTIHLTKEEFLKKVANYEANPTEWKYLGDKPCIIDFYADWCGPCKEMAPSIEKIAKTYKGRVKVLKINVDENSRLVKQLGISGIPKLYIYKNGKESWSKSGLTDYATIEKALL